GRSTWRRPSSASQRGDRGRTALMRAVLLLSCPDRKGLVAAVSQFIYLNDGAIVAADQHTDFERKIFLQRVEWDLDGFRIPHEAIAEAFRPIAERFEMSWDLRFDGRLPRMALMVSRLDHCLHDLLWRHRAGELTAEIPVIVSNHPDLQPVAAGFGIPF